MQCADIAQCVPNFFRRHRNGHCLSNRCHRELREPHNERCRLIMILILSSIIGSPFPDVIN
jgi:hypothetical protein